MESKIQKEEFDSTEVKIKEASDISDGWEFMPKHEAEMESVPHLSVPKMHEQIEKCDSPSSVIEINSGRRREQEIFSDQVQEKDHEIVQKEIEEAMQENFQSEAENERVRREMVEAMQDLIQDHEKDRLKREVNQLRQTVHQNDHEKDRLKKELDELKQTVQQMKQEKDGLIRELRELRQAFEAEKEKNSGRRESYELEQTMPQNEKEKEIDRMRREKELHEAMLDTLQNEQESNTDKRKTDEVSQDKDSALRATESLESQIHAVEGESSAKGIDEGKTKVLEYQFEEALRQLDRDNQAAKVVIPVKITNNLEGKNYVELTSKHVAYFQKKGIEFASSDDESNE